ncbi:MAG: helix-turn-helix domain-containing protein [Bacteroidetes bacterium]|nr:helix-turn-helix domain-containing protein [Bacteroidota bacterium]
MHNRSNEEFLMAFGLNLRTIRKAKNLKQYHVADRCGIHKNNYTNIERGKRNITIVKAQSIAKALDVPVAELFAF